MLNIITIHAIKKTSSFSHSNLKTSLLSLAVSDLGVGLLVQPLYIVVLVMEMKQNTENNPTFNNTYKVFLFTANLFGFASFFGVTALSADRFLSIHFHLRYQERVTHKRVAMVLVLVWILSAFLSLIRLWIPANIMYFIFVIIEVACVILAAYFNFKIFVVTRSHADQIQALQVQQAVQNGDMTNVASVRISAAVTLALYLVFLICYLPQICILTVTGISGQSIVLKLSLRHTMTLVFLNSSLNPLIYCWKMRHVGHAVMSMLQHAFSNDK